MLIDIFALKLILKVFIMPDYVTACLTGDVCINTVVSAVCHITGVWLSLSVLYLS